MVDPETGERFRYLPREAVAALKLLVATPHEEKDAIDAQVIEAPRKTEVLKTFGVSPAEEEVRQNALVESGLLADEPS